MSRGKDRIAITRIEIITITTEATQPLSYSTAYYHCVMNETSALTSSSMEGSTTLVSRKSRQSRPNEATAKCDSRANSSPNSRSFKSMEAHDAQLLLIGTDTKMSVKRKAQNDALLSPPPAKKRRRETITAAATPKFKSESFRKRVENTIELETIADNLDKASEKTFVEKEKASKEMQKATARKEKVQQQQCEEVRAWQLGQTQLAAKRQQKKDLKDELEMLNRNIATEEALLAGFVFDSSTLPEAAMDEAAAKSEYAKAQAECEDASNRHHTSSRDYKERSEQWLDKDAEDIFEEVGVPFSYDGVNGLATEDAILLRRGMKRFGFLKAKGFLESSTRKPDMVKEVCVAVGIEVPPSPTASDVMLQWEQLRLKLKMEQEDDDESDEDEE